MQGDPGLIRLGSVCLGVPDPDETARFLATGLDFAASSRPDGGWDVAAEGEYAFPVPKRNLTLLPGDDMELREVTFDTPEGYGFEELERRARDEGLKTVPVAPDEDGGAGLSLLDDHGLRLTCRPPGPARSQPLPPSALRPRRLGHVNLNVPDPRRTVELICDVLGLRLSEQIGEDFYFLRIGSEHHNLGIRGASQTPSAHHVGFEVAGWESYRVICDHLAGLGHRVEYGPGRHGPGRNLFVYLRDPSSGLRLELYSDMAHIHDEKAYEPVRWELRDRPRTVNRWGPAPPESYLT